MADETKVSQRKLAMYIVKRIVDKRSVEKCPHLNNNM